MNGYSEGTIVPGSEREKMLRAAAQEAMKKKFTDERFKQSTDQNGFDEKALAYEMANKLDELPDELMEGEEGFYQEWLKRKEDAQQRQAEIKAGYIAAAKAREEELRRQIKMGTPHIDENPTGEWRVVKDAKGNVIDLQPRYAQQGRGGDADSPSRRAGPREPTSVFSAAELQQARGGDKHQQAPTGFLQKAGSFFKKLVG